MARPKGAKGKKTLEKEHLQKEKDRIYNLYKSGKLVEGDGKPETTDISPIDYFLQVINDPEAPADLKMKAAIEAAPYVHNKLTGKASKKEDPEDKAKSAGKGKFAPAKAPNLKVLGQK